MSIQEVFTEINRKTVTILGRRGFANDRRGRAKTDSVPDALTYGSHMQDALLAFLSLYGGDVIKLIHLKSRVYYSEIQAEKNRNPLLACCLGYCN